MLQCHCARCSQLTTTTQVSAVAPPAVGSDVGRPDSLRRRKCICLAPHWLCCRTKLMHVRRQATSTADELAAEAASTADEVVAKAARGRDRGRVHGGRGRAEAASTADEVVARLRLRMTAPSQRRLNLNQLKHVFFSGETSIWHPSSRRQRDDAQHQARHSSCRAISLRQWTRSRNRARRRRKG